MSHPIPGHTYGENEYKDEVRTGKERQAYIKKLNHNASLLRKRREMASKFPDKYLSKLHDFHKHQMAAMSGLIIDATKKDPLKHWRKTDNGPY